MSQRTVTFTGKTIVVGELLSANETTAKFNINGNEVVITAELSTEKFKSPLEREDETTEPRTMAEFLMHKVKSAKRKFKLGDSVLLILNKYKDKTTGKSIYRMQNAKAFVRKEHMVDDQIYHGFTLAVDDFQQMIRHDENGKLPLYSMRFISKEDNHIQTLEKIQFCIDKLKLTTFQFSKKTDNDWINKTVSTIPLTIPDVITYDEFKEEVKDVNTLYQVSFFVNASKKTPLFEEKQIFMKNLVPTKIPFYFTEIDSLVMENIISFYEPIEETINTQKFKKKVLFGKKYSDSPLKVMNSSAILGFKETFNEKDESFFILTKAIPDLPVIRDKETKYWLNKIEHEKALLNSVPTDDNPLIETLADF